MADSKDATLAELLVLFKQQSELVQGLVSRHDALEKKLEPLLSETSPSATPPSGGNNNNNNSGSDNHNNTNDTDKDNKPKGTPVTPTVPTPQQSAPVTGGAGQPPQSQQGSSSFSKTPAKAPVQTPPHISNPFEDGGDDEEYEDSQPSFFPQGEGTLSPFDDNLPSLFEDLVRKVHHLRLDRDCIWKKAMGFKGESRKEIAALKKVFSCLEIMLKALDKHDVAGHGTDELFIDCRTATLAAMYAILSRRKYLFVHSNTNEEVAKTFESVRGHSSELSREEQEDLLFAAKLGKENQRFKDAESRKKGKSNGFTPNNNNNQRRRQPYNPNNPNNLLDRSVRNNTNTPRSRPQTEQGGGSG